MGFLYLIRASFEFFDYGLMDLHCSRTANGYDCDDGTKHLSNGCGITPAQSRRWAGGEIIRFGAMAVRCSGFEVRL